jgi:hypothetical protein
MEDEVANQNIRYQLSANHLQITKGGSSLFDYIDSFVELSRENTIVKEVTLYPFDSDAGNYEFWDKVGQIVGNLMNVHTLNIHLLPYPDNDDDDDDRVPDWEILTRILPYLRRKVALDLIPETYDAEVEIQGLARAIHGHPMISGFSSHMGFSYANLVPWCSALVTLPSLENVIFCFKEPETEDQRDLVNLEPLKELLRAPALRVVGFNPFYFTNELCHVVARVLEETSSIIELSFLHGCTLPDGGRAIITNALKRNASVTYVEFSDDFDESFCNTLAAVLLSNSTLQNLTLQLSLRASGRWLS